MSKLTTNKENKYILNYETEKEEDFNKVESLCKELINKEKEEDEDRLDKVLDNIVIRIALPENVNYEDIVNYLIFDENFVDLFNNGCIYLHGNNDENRRMIDFFNVIGVYEGLITEGDNLYAKIKVLNTPLSRRFLKLFSDDNIKDNYYIIPKGLTLVNHAKNKNDYLVISSFELKYNEKKG